MLKMPKKVLKPQDITNASLTIAGGFDKGLKENVEEYLEELKDLAEKEGVSDQITFITSCSTAERNDLLSESLCVLYTPKVARVIWKNLLIRRNGVGPKCKFYVEKTEGCLHITCRCQYEFCYACGEKWTSNHGGCQRN